jgi:hypothetical protein
MARQKPPHWRAPDELSICGERWRLIRKSEASNEGLALENRRCIVLDADTIKRNPDTEGPIWTHEILHALRYSSGFMEALAAILKQLDLSDERATQLAIDIDEVHSRIIAPALWGMLRGNRMRFD